MKGGCAGERDALLSRPTDHIREMQNARVHTTSYLLPLLLPQTLSCSPATAGCHSWSVCVGGVGGLMPSAPLQLSAEGGDFEVLGLQRPLLLLRQEVGVSSVAWVM